MNDLPLMTRARPAYVEFATTEAALQALRARMTERDFQAQVVALAKLHGWRTFHVFDSRHSAAGFPDLTLVRANRDGDGQLLFIELKREGAKPTAAQWEWVHLLRSVPGVRAFIWRPSDLPTIEKLLKGDIV